MSEQYSFDAAAFLNQVTEQSGVYRMYNSSDDVIYVGKAKNLKKRLSSYFRKNLDSVKTQSLVSHIHHIDVTVTHTETEAFILENNYIKKYKPKYNILMRDDKSYPYIMLSSHAHPRLTAHRGSKRGAGELFGPYPSGWAVKESLRVMQKIFPIRQCEDAYYKARTRPCLQYQLQRCSAPCVKGHVSDEDYAQTVQLARLFLQGKNQDVMTLMVNKMESASSELNFEKAAQYRDQIAALRKVQEQQSVSGNEQEMDVFGYANVNGTVCVYTIFIRDNKVLGSKSYFPKVPATMEDTEVLSSFVSQFYLAGNKSIPKQIVLPFKLDDETAMARLLSEQATRKVSLFLGARGEKKRYLNLAMTNADTSALSRQSHNRSVHQRYLSLESAIDRQDPIQRMECFDISHTAGQQTVASCVVFNREGPLKSDYRRYNIEGITPGDDYAAMAQALKKRYKKPTEVEKIPDILFIDGGKGQLGQAERFFDEWPSEKVPLLIGVAKGTSRKAGLETLILAGSHDTIPMDADNPGLHLVQHIRDESHRFAIAGHRHKRNKQAVRSSLENIPGIGAKKRQALLKYMGGIQEVKNASVEGLAKVPGISVDLAQTIYDHLNH